MQKNITYLIFDLDGTLIDSSPAILASFAQVLAKNQLTAQVPLNKNLIGPPLPATLSTITGIHDAAHIKQLIDDFKAIYDSEGLYATSVYQNVDQTLRQLHAEGKKLYIATNKREHPTLLLLKHFKWESLFSAIYCTDSRKPPFINKDEMLQELIRAKSINKEGCLFIGDTLPDANAALSNQVNFLAATWGYGDWANIPQQSHWQLITEAGQIMSALKN